MNEIENLEIKVEEEVYAKITAIDIKNAHDIFGDKAKTNGRYLVIHFENEELGVRGNDTFRLPEKGMPHPNSKLYKLITQYKLPPKVKNWIGANVKVFVDEKGFWRIVIRA